MWQSLQVSGKNSHQTQGNIQIRTPYAYMGEAIFSGITFTSGKSFFRDQGWIYSFFTFDELLTKKNTILYFQQILYSLF